MYIDYSLYFEILTHQFNDIVTLKEGESIIGDNAKFYEALNEKKLTVKTVCVIIKSKIR
mgnify:CR=1 FL=1